MIRVRKIAIKEFRGIRDLTLNFEGKNFAVCGPNGTGKSGIVDALEFGLTGSISRLSGKGQGNVSVKEHGPHVNARKNPETAIVSIEVDIASLGKVATITRDIKNAKTPIITPDEPAVRKIFQHIEDHPEFALSRREIIKYVLAEPSDRAKQLQALLQLDDLTNTRANLLKIKNATEKEAKTYLPLRENAGDGLMRALEVSELKQPVILTAVNERRSLLNLSPLTKLEATTSFRDGLESQATPALSKVPKAQAKADTQAAIDALGAITDAASIAMRAEVLVTLEVLKENEAVLSNLAKDEMLELALTHFDEQICPVCETEWDPEAFRAVVNAQREHFSDAKKQRSDAEEKLAGTITLLETAHSGLSPLAKYAANLPSPVTIEAVTALESELKERLGKLRAFLPLDECIAAITFGTEQLAVASTQLQQLLDGIETIPEPTDRDAARDYLTVAQERIEAFRSAAQKHQAAAKRAITAAKVYDIYNDSTDKALVAIYKEVEAEFRAYYRAINGDDEKDFQAQLTPSFGKLSFEVDFYGKGFFPPGAYHSEGHQDGMGLCLYLALMKHLLGKGFSFAVLDDVLMSVDVGHRREVCTLLKASFPDTQFILTTHDGVWLRHMKTAKLIGAKNGIEFRKWHVDQGPSEWKDSDVWAEIDAYVDQNDIRSAAALLRNYLEHIAAEICGRLGGKVEYRLDGRYDLGSLLPSAITALRDIYKLAKSSANSWNNQQAMDLVATQETAYSALVAAALVDQWQINPSVHYNEWANLVKEDFKPVVDAFKNLEAAFTCPTCQGLLHLSYAGQTKDAAKCDCSGLNYNLTKKPVS